LENSSFGFLGFVENKLLRISMKIQQTFNSNHLGFLLWFGYFVIVTPRGLFNAGSSESSEII
jgi:hypothetical protein